MEDNEKQNDTEEIIQNEQEQDGEINEADSELHRIIYGGEYSEYGDALGSDEEEEDEDDDEDGKEIFDEAEE